MSNSLNLSEPQTPLLATVGRLTGFAGGGEARSRRIMVLIAGIIALSLADLFVTVTHLRTIGMIEANPIAAYLVVNYQSVWVLAAYKMFTVAVCIATLYYIRKQFLGEVAAWTSVAILACMAVVWHLYAAELDDPGKLALVQHAAADDGWIYLSR